MAVWPDMSPDWEDVDRYPNSEHRNRAYRAIERLDMLTGPSIGAEVDALNPDGTPFLRLAPDALVLFREWRHHLELRLRSGDLGPHLESHLAKYRKLVPALALIYHLVDGGTGSIGEVAMLSALAWVDYLESHAKRIYRAGTAGEVEGAKVILRNLQRGRLETTFSARDVKRKGWAPMGEDVAKVQTALDLLVDYGWIAAKTVPGGKKGGRSTTLYRANPKGLKG